MSPGRELLYFQGAGLQHYKLVFQETENVRFWILAAQMAVVLVHFKEKKYEICVNHMKAQMQLSTLRSLNMRPCQRKLIFSVEQKHSLVSKKAS